MSIKIRIDKKLKNKKNLELVKTAIMIKKKEKWLKIADIISRSRRNKIQVNLDKINLETKEGDTVVIPGKVLGQGEIAKKIRIAALGFSQEARKKLEKTNSEIVTIADEFKKNPNATGVKIIAQNGK